MHGTPETLLANKPDSASFASEQIFFAKNSIVEQGIIAALGINRETHFIENFMVVGAAAIAITRPIRGHTSIKGDLVIKKDTWIFAPIDS